MTTYSKILSSGALTAVTSSSVGSYTMPAGKGGRLVGVIVGFEGTAETAVSQGGKVTLTNNSEAWEPFELELPVQESLILTEGGTALAPPPIAYRCNKKFPDNSVATATVILNDNGSTIVRVQLMWVH